DTYPHNNEFVFGWEQVSDWESLFWYTGSKHLSEENNFRIHKMPLKEAVEKGYVTVEIQEGMLDDIEAYNALLEATRAAPLTDEEIEQIRFFADHINNCCEGLAFSAPIRTTEPTE